MFSFCFNLEKAKLAAITKAIAKGSNTNIITKIYQLIILSIAIPVSLLKYFNGPNSLSPTAVFLISKILDSNEKIESFTTSILADNLSFDLEADSMLRIAALFDLTTKLPFLSVY